MMSSSDICRSQQALHEERAAMATLENVRIISVRAALAWAKEGRSAVQREARDKLRRVVPHSVLSDDFHAPPLKERGLSENPDRGLATPNPVGPPSRQPSQATLSQPTTHAERTQ